MSILIFSCYWFQQWRHVHFIWYDLNHIWDWHNLINLVEVWNSLFINNISGWLVNVHIFGVEPPRSRFQDSWPPRRPPSGILSDDREWSIINHCQTSSIFYAPFSNIINDLSTIYPPFSTILNHSHQFSTITPAQTWTMRPMWQVLISASYRSSLEELYLFGLPKKEHNQVPQWHNLAQQDLPSGKSNIAMENLHSQKQINLQMVA